MILLPLHLLACVGSAPDDSAGRPGPDADTDTDTDTDMDMDTDADADADTDTDTDDADRDGYSAAGGDCDDADPAVNPGATEVCDDGKDNDCDGSPDGCGPSSMSLSGAIEYTGEVAGDDASYTVARAGDVNADGYDDIVVGAYRSSAAGSSSGAAYLVLGSPSPTSASLATGIRYAGEAAGDYAGTGVAGVGDADGDGYDDVLVGAYGNGDGGNGAGAVYLINGGPSPASGSLSSTVEHRGEGANNSAGIAVAAAGDVDGDGLADAVVGAAYNGSAGANAGAAYLLLGSSSATPASLSSAPKFAGAGANNCAGFSVGGGGDVDGDGLSDILVGAYLNSDAGTYAGAAYLVLGSASPASAGLGSAVEYTGEAAGDYAGFAVAGGGDADGDGYGDVLVGATHNGDGGTDAGAAYLVLGSASPRSGSLSSHLQFTGEAGGDAAGISVANAGDIDRDGYDDALVGAYVNADGGASAGAGYYVRGGPVPASVDLGAVVQFSGEAAGDWAGRGVAGAGDVDGDGHADMLFGAPENDDAGASAGAAFLVLGTGL